MKLVPYNTETQYGGWYECEFCGYIEALVNPLINSDNLKGTNCLRCHLATEPREPSHQCWECSAQHAVNQLDNLLKEALP